MCQQFGRRGAHIAVPDHEAETYDVDARAEDDGWFVVFGIFDQEGGGYCGDGWGEWEGVSYTSSCSDRFVLDDEEVGVEVWLDGEEVGHYFLLVLKTWYISY